MILASASDSSFWRGILTDPLRLLQDIAPYCENLRELPPGPISVGYWMSFRVADNPFSRNRIDDRPPEDAQEVGAPKSERARIGHGEEIGLSENVEILNRIYRRRRLQCGPRIFGECSDGRRRERGPWKTARDHERAVPERS